MPQPRRRPTPKDFLDDIKGPPGSEEARRKAQERLLGLAEQIILPAVTKDGPMRRALGEQMFPFIHRQMSAAELVDVPPHGKPPRDVSHGEAVALAATQLRVLRALEDDDVAERVSEKLRHEEDVEKLVREGVEKFDRDFAANLARDAAKHGERDKAFGRRLRETVDSLEGFAGGRLRELATAGEGQINSPWQVSVVFVCPLAWILCAIGAALFIAIIVIIWVWGW